MKPTEQLFDEVKESRRTEHDINPVFLNRWSPRSFAEREVTDQDLNALFEAARWAPSSNNEQSWRYIVARKPEDRTKFYEFINPGNRLWCEKAPVLTLLLSKKINSRGNFHSAHAFEAGTAWGFLALEATIRGLITHAMGGFDRDKARSIMGISDDYELHAVVAIGYQGAKEALPEDMQLREKPSLRRPLIETVFEGQWRP